MKNLILKTYVAALCENNEGVSQTPFYSSKMELPFPHKIPHDKLDSYAASLNAALAVFPSIRESTKVSVHTPAFTQSIFSVNPTAASAPFWTIEGGINRTLGKDIKGSRVTNSEEDYYNKKTKEVGYKKSELVSVKVFLNKYEDKKDWTEDLVNARLSEKKEFINEIFNRILSKEKLNE